jgi:hypothetical protein
MQYRKRKALLAGPPFQKGATMRTKLMLAAVFAMALVGCGEIQGDGNIVEQERPAGVFSGVFLAEGLHGEVSVGPVPSVKIRGDSNLLEYIQLVIREGVLTSELEGSQGLLPSEPIVITIVTPTLRELRALNGTVLNASGIDTESFWLRVNGRSRVNVSGSAGKLTLATAGDSDVQAGELAAEVALIDVSGSSEARLHVTRQVTGTASTGSHVIIQGNPPQSDIATSGGSQVLFE